MNNFSQNTPQRNNNSRIRCSTLNQPQTPSFKFQTSTPKFIYQQPLVPVINNFSKGKEMMKQQSEIDSYKKQLVEKEQNILALQLDQKKCKILQEKFDEIFQENSKLEKLSIQLESKNQKTQESLDEKSTFSANLQQKIVSYQSETKTLQQIINAKSQEIENYRSKIRNIEQKLHSLQLKESNYASAIRDLEKQVEIQKNLQQNQQTQNQQSLLNLKGQHELELKDVKHNNSLLKQDIESWKKKYSEIQKSYLSEVSKREDKILELNTENQIKLNQINQKEKMIVKFQTTNSELEKTVENLKGFESELGKIKDILQLKSKQCLDFSQKYDQQISKTQKIEVENGELQAQVEFLEEKFSEKNPEFSHLLTLDSENERMSQKMKKMIEKIDFLENQHEKLKENEQKSQNQALEMEEMYSLLENDFEEAMKYKDMFETQQELSLLKEEMICQMNEENEKNFKEQQEISKIASQIPVLEKLTETQKDEISALKNQNLQKTSEITDLSDKVIEKQEMIKFMEVFVIENDNLKVYKSHIAQKLDEQISRNNQLDLKISQIQAQFQEIQNQKDNLQCINEQMKQQIHQNGQIIEKSEKNTREKDAQILHLRKFEQKSQESENQIRNLASEIGLLKRTISEKSQQISSQSQHLNEKDLEFQIVQKKNQVLEQKIQNLNYQNSRLNEEIDRLQREDNLNQLELNDWRSNQAQNSNLSTQIQHQMMLLVLNGAIIETLQNRLNQKDKEVEDVRRSSFMINNKLTL